MFLQGILIALDDSVSDAQKEFAAANARPRKKGTGIVAVLLIMMVAVGGFWWLRSQTGETAKAESVTPVESTLHLETFVLNLAGSNERSYLRVGIDLGLDQDAKHAQEIIAIAEVRDTILGTLAEAKADDLLTSPGKAKLKENVLRALQARVPALRVKEIYFTELLIQR